MRQRIHQTSGMIGGAILLALACSVSAPAAADEIEDSLALALEAYQNGDIADAKSEIDYVAQLLSQKQSAALMTILPPPFEGWSQEELENAAVGAAMFGGGMTASADYRRDNENVEIQVMADSPMLAAMMGMFGNPALAGATGGKMKRIGGQKVIATQDGEIQAVISNRFMVQISGSASMEDKEAYFTAIDFDALAGL